MVSSDSSTPLFWTEAYWRKNRSQGAESICVKSEEGGTLYFSRSRSEIAVPGSATFGGWWPNDGTGAERPDWVKVFDELFRRFPNHHWEFSLPPGYFRPDVFASQALALERFGASETIEINSAITITPENHALPHDGFSRGNKKRVRAFDAMGGTVRQAQNSEINSAFNLLQANRMRRGVELSMGETKFHDLIVSASNAYRCWLAEANSELMGVALTVDISDEVTYVLYWGDSPAGRAISVTASLCRYLLAHAALEGKRFLDLGISSVDGQVDEGLMRFKDNLGAQRYEQRRYYLSTPKRLIHPK